MQNSLRSAAFYKVYTSLRFLSRKGPYIVTCDYIKEPCRNGSIVTDNSSIDWYILVRILLLKVIKIFPCSLPIVLPIVLPVCLACLFRLNQCTLVLFLKEGDAIHIGKLATLDVRAPCQWIFVRVEKCVSKILIVSSKQNSSTVTDNSSTIVVTGRFWSDSLCCHW